MNICLDQNTIAGLIEYRGQIVAVRIPIALLIMSASSYALSRVQCNRSEALDVDYTMEERTERRRRADAIEAWVKNNCAGSVAFDDDATLYVRSAFAPVTVTPQKLEAYLDAVLAVNFVASMESVETPQFLIRNGVNSGAEIWLTNHRALRAARLHPGEIRLIETSSDALKALIATQQGNPFATFTALPS